MKSSLLYRSIKDHVRETARHGEDGTRLPSQTELSRMFNANHLTVRRALEELEEERLIYRIQGKGTFVRKRGTEQALARIFMLLPSFWQTTALIAAVTEGMLEGIRGRRIQLSLHAFFKNPSEILHVLKSQDMNGVIGVWPNESELLVLRELYERSYSVLVLNRVIEHPPLSYVSTDHERGAREMAEYLVGKGHRRFCIVGVGEASHLKQRYAGFSKVLKEKGIYFDKKMTVELIPLKDGRYPFSWDNVSADFDKVLGQYKPTAVFITGISGVPRVMDIVRKRKLKIPDAIEVATYDEIMDDCPEKAVIHEIVQPMYEIGKTAIERIEDVTRGQRVKVLLPAQLKLKRTITQRR